MSSHPFELRFQRLHDTIFSLKPIVSVECVEVTSLEGKRAKINYKPLWKMLIDKGLSKAELREKTSIARSTMVKMTNNEYAAMDVLVRICIALNCSMDDIVEIERTIR